uniref:Uncharacterized protein n=1 Tax=Anguilla anguilla TaxID=7936 RepID=A0A0E9R8A7_ANGAN
MMGNVVHLFCGFIRGFSQSLIGAEQNLG